MDVICIALGNVTLGTCTRGPDGEVTKKTEPKAEIDPEGCCTMVWTVDSATDQQTAPVQIFGDWQAAEYLAYILELLKPKRAVNIPNFESIVKLAAAEGVNFCEYCLECRCNDCIVNEWRNKE